MTRIAVLGAGANGASIGADLTRAGLDVMLIEQWPAHVEAMRAHGVRIEMPDETVTTRVDVLHLCDVATLRRSFDLVLMLVKAYDSVWASHLIEPVLASDGLLVGVQNGMTADAIQRVVGPERTLGCVIEITSAMDEPGVVRRDSPFDRSWFAVGALDGHAAGREREVAAALGHSGTVQIVDDIRSAKWMKLVSNATTLVTTAVLGLPMVEAAAIPEMRALMLRSGREALAVATASGRSVLPIFGLTNADVADESRVVQVLLDTLLGGFVLPTSTTTVLQDWRKGRRSEVGELNGHVAEEGRVVGVSTPVNDVVVEIARRIEAGELVPHPGNLALLLSRLDAAS